MNSDNKDTLSPIGYYRGDGDTVVPEFNATRYELGQLIEMWAEVVVDHQWMFWLIGDAGQYKSATYAKRRIAAIADLIGEEDAQKIVDVVKHNFGKNKNPKWWHLFCHGATEEERNQMEKEVWAELAAVDRAAVFDGFEKSVRGVDNAQPSQCAGPDEEARETTHSDRRVIQKSHGR